MTVFVFSFTSAIFAFFVGAIFACQGIFTFGTVAAIFALGFGFFAGFTGALFCLVGFFCFGFASASITGVGWGGCAQPCKCDNCEYGNESCHFGCLQFGLVIPRK